MLKKQNQKKVKKHKPKTTRKFDPLYFVTKEYCVSTTTDFNENLAKLRLLVESYQTKKDKLALSLLEVQESRNYVAKQLKAKIVDHHKKILELRNRELEIKELLELEREEFFDILDELKDKYVLVQDRLYQELKILTGKLLLMTDIHVDYDVIFALLQQQNLRANENTYKKKTEIFEYQFQLLLEHNRCSEEGLNILAVVTNDCIKAKRLKQQEFFENLKVEFEFAHRRLQKLSNNYIRISRGPLYIRCKETEQNYIYLIESLEPVVKQLQYVFSNRKNICENLKAAINEKKKQYVKDLQYRTLYYRVTNEEYKSIVEENCINDELIVIRKRITKVKEQINNIHNDRVAFKDQILHLLTTINMIKRRVMLTKIALDDYETLDTNKDRLKACVAMHNIRQDIIIIFKKIIEDYYYLKTFDFKTSYAEEPLYKIGDLGFKLKPTMILNDDYQEDHLEKALKKISLKYEYFDMDELLKQVPMSEIIRMSKLSHTLKSNVSKVKTQNNDEELVEDEDDLSQISSDYLNYITERYSNDGSEDIQLNIWRTSLTVDNLRQQKRIDLFLSRTFSKAISFAMRPIENDTTWRRSLKNSTYGQEQDVDRMRKATIDFLFEK